MRALSTTPPGSRPRGTCAAPARPSSRLRRTIGRDEGQDKPPCATPHDGAAAPRRCRHAMSPQRCPPATLRTPSGREKFAASPAGRDVRPNPGEEEIMLDLDTLRSEIAAFNARGQTGPDPVARLYRERRKQWSLFTPRLSDAEIEALRPYIFCYERLPETPDDKPIPLRNFIGGEWRPAARSVVMHAQFDRRIPLCELPASDEHDVAAALAVAEDYWASLEWADEVVSYRKWVVQNFSRILEYFMEECLAEIRHQIPKTRLEAEKDFWEAKRASD